MPIVWANHDNKQIFLNVAVLGAAEAALVLQGKSAGNIQMFKALVDTGAMATCITAAAAAKLKLSPIGKVAIQGVSGTRDHNNYLFHIGFTLQIQQLGAAPAASQAVVPGQMPVELNLLPTPIQGAEFDAGTHGFDVLLGMDVISIGVLHVGNRVFNWAW